MRVNDTSVRWWLKLCEQEKSVYLYEGIICG